MLNKKTLHYFSFNNPGHQSDSKFQAIHDLFVVFLRWVAMAPYVMIQGENRKLWHHWKKRKPFIPITKRESNKVNIQIHQPSSSSLWISQLMIFQLEIPKKLPKLAHATHLRKVAQTSPEVQSRGLPRTTWIENTTPFGTLKLGNFEGFPLWVGNMFEGV